MKVYHAYLLKTDLPIFAKTVTDSTESTHPVFNPTDNSQPARESSPAASSNSWDVAQPSVSTHNATPIPAYGDKASPPENEATFGSGTPPSPTPFATGAKSPTDGSQISDKPNSLRAGDKKTKKGGKNLAKETVIESHKLAGFQGDKSIDELLEFVEGDKVKVKKLIKEKKSKESKPKGNEKQVLSKAASLDENSLGYGSKKSGVIEALNDTGAAGDSSAITKIPVDCTVASPPSVGQPSVNESSRSQDQMSTPINGAESQTEMLPLKKDQLSKSIEKPNQKNANPNTSISLLTRVQSPTIVSSVPEQSLPKPHEEPPKIETVVESQSTASANVPLQTIKNATSNPQTGANATTEKSPKIDIAQLYRPPKCTLIPTTVRLAGEYLDAYASRLSRQIRDGNVLFHRV